MPQTVISPGTTTGRIRRGAPEGKQPGRLILNTMTGMKGWQPGRKMLKATAEMQREGRL